MKRFKKLAATLKWVAAIIEWLNKYFSIIVEAIETFPPYPSESNTQQIINVETDVNLNVNKDEHS